MNTRSLSLLAGLAVAGLAYCPSAKAENLIPNPSFESGAAGWVLFIPKDAEGKVQPLQIVQTDVHSGTAAAAITVADGARTGITSKPVNVKPGEKYRISAWVKFTDNVQFKAGSVGAFLRATLMETPGKDIADPAGHMHIGLKGTVARNPDVGKLGVSELPKQWTKLEAVIEIPAGTGVLLPTVFVMGVTGTVLIDDVNLELVPAATPLSSFVQ